MGIRVLYYSKLGVWGLLPRAVYAGKIPAASIMRYCLSGRKIRSGMRRLPQLFVFYRMGRASLRLNKWEPFSPIFQGRHDVTNPLTA